MITPCNALVVRKHIPGFHDKAVQLAASGLGGSCLVFPYALLLSLAWPAFLLYDVIWGGLTFSHTTSYFSGYLEKIESLSDAIFVGVEPPTKDF